MENKFDRIGFSYYFDLYFVFPVPVCCIFPPDEINMRSEIGEVWLKKFIPLVLKYLACTGFLDRFVFSGEKIRHLEI